MANAEHLEILKQGVEVWNRWRQFNPEVLPDLSLADFSGFMLPNIDLQDANLASINFNRTQLIGANLSNTMLYGAFLENSNLRGANLCNANLINSDLSDSIMVSAKFIGANFQDALVEFCDIRNACLIGANFNNSTLKYAFLGGADLRKVNFVDANLFGTDLTKCIIGGTIFGLTNLNYVTNLESVVVNSRCVIDFHTMKNSNSLPKEFLFKIGLPENYINYLPDFFDEKPIRMHPAFLSHSSKDKPFATKLYEALIARKVLVWYDERKLLPGDNLIEGISKGIDLYDKFILVCSKQSLQESWWVDKELNRALDKEIRLFKEKGRQINTIIPITIDDYVFKEWDGAKRSDIHRYNIGDFRDWQDDAKFEAALDKLVMALNADRGGEEVVSYL